MCDYLVKLTQGKHAWYLVWCSIVDSPITYGMPLEEFKKFYKVKYGRKSFKEDFPDRMARVEEKGTSALYLTLKELLAANRAGKNDQHLTKREIIRNCCINRPGKEILYPGSGEAYILKLYPSSGAATVLHFQNRQQAFESARSLEKHVIGISRVTVEDPDGELLYSNSHFPNTRKRIFDRQKTLDSFWIRTKI
jgi:hypothetical protein